MATMVRETADMHLEGEGRNQDDWKVSGASPEHQEWGGGGDLCSCHFLDAQPSLFKKNLQEWVFSLKQMPQNAACRCLYSF